MIIRVVPRAILANVDSVAIGDSGHGTGEKDRSRGDQLAIHVGGDKLIPPEGGNELVPITVAYQRSRGRIHPRASRAGRLDAEPAATLGSDNPPDIAAAVPIFV